MTTSLAYGWNRGLVAGLKAGYGARWIIDQDGHVDPVPTRSSSFGEDAAVDEIYSWLNGKDPTHEAETVFAHAVKSARAGLINRAILTREARGIVLHQDGRGAVIANTNASAGYLYVAAYLYEHLPVEHPTKGLEYALNLETQP